MKARFPFFLLSILIVMSMLLSACAQATPTTAPAVDEPTKAAPAEATAAPAPA